MAELRQIVVCFALVVWGSACVDLNPPWGALPWTGGRAGALDSGIGGAGGTSGGQTGRADATTVDGAGGVAEGGTFGTGGIVVAGGSSGSAGRNDAAADVSHDGASGGSAGAAHAGGTAGTGGVVGTGGIPAAGGATASGGSLGSGGKAAAGGAVSSGGKTASGGIVGSGGVVAVGGAVTTGGASSGCGTEPSTFSEQHVFNSSTSLLDTSPTPLPTGMQLAFSTTGPTSNKSLCSAGCAVLSISFTDGMPAYSYVATLQLFSSTVNLVGATVEFAYAIDNPANVPIQMQSYASGDASAGWKWAPPSTVAGADLAAFSAATGFAVQKLKPVDSGTGYCASATKIIGLQVQNTVAITTSNAGMVTIYISSLTVTP